MKLCQASRFLYPLACFVFFAGFLKVSNAAAQADAASSAESVLPVQVSPVDEIAAEDVAGHHVHIHQQRSAVSNRFSPLENNEARPNVMLSGTEAAEAAATAHLAVPSVPSPGFYPADLSNPTHGTVLHATQSNNIYVNCAASCWGNPATFLSHLAQSNFIHVTDEYVGTTANNRYTVGAATSIKTSLPAKLTPTNVLSLVHAAAHTHGSGYDHVYHLFLPKGTDVCLSPTVCYSPDNANTFIFCAFHGSTDFKDIGHVLFSVEPYQNVPGCAVAQPSPNGALVDSTASTLSHELIEAITDPDGTAWVAQSSLIDYGAEIGDLCETPFGKYAPLALFGKSYTIQPEYSNRFHACATTP